MENYVHKASLVHLSSVLNQIVHLTHAHLLSELSQEAHFLCLS